MTWLANPSSSKSGFRSTFRNIVVFFFIFGLYDAFVAPPLWDATITDDGGVSIQQQVSPVWHQILYLLISLPMSIYGLLVVVRLRGAIRAKYGISVGCLGRFEDFCCVCCCNCCVLAQMARQTADYDVEQAACCTPSGMRHTKTVDTDVEHLLAVTEDHK